MEIKLKYPAATIDDLLDNINALAHGNNIKEAVVAHETISSGTEDFSALDGAYHLVAAGGDFTVSFSDWPEEKISSITMICINFGAYNVTFPAEVMWGVNGEPAWQEDGFDFVRFYYAGGVIFVEVLRSIEFLRCRIDTIYKPESDTLTAKDLSGTNISNFGQGESVDNTQTLCACGPGFSAAFKIVEVGAGYFYLAPDSSDKIYIDNVALDDGDRAAVAAPESGAIHTFIIESFKDDDGTYNWALTSGPNTTVEDGGPIPV